MCNISLYFFRQSKTISNCMYIKKSIFHRCIEPLTFSIKKHINWLIFRIFLVKLRVHLTNFMVDSISQLWFVVRRAKKSGWFMTGSYFGDNWICLDWYFSLASPVHNRVKIFVFRIWIILFYILVTVVPCSCAII